MVDDDENGRDRFRCEMWSMDVCVCVCVIVILSLYDADIATKQ